MPSDVASLIVSLARWWIVCRLVPRRAIYPREKAEFRRPPAAARPLAHEPLSECADAMRHCLAFLSPFERRALSRTHHCLAGAECDVHAHLASRRRDFEARAEVRNPDWQCPPSHDLFFFFAGNLLISLSNLAYMGYLGQRIGSSVSFCVLPLGIFWCWVSVDTVWRLACALRWSVRARVLAELAPCQVETGL
ncbi:unnamed protein product [Prorocentrum cordatum]|uniref:Uncharacterized protein n=1 Tax=Prorocentrum cordatum TaxID=2364126 RepID=A0ABN9XPT5_9DINO|nr:unnamed protein product [Polarella glacialis]